jgi:hypothetical protein
MSNHNQYQSLLKVCALAVVLAFACTSRLNAESLEAVLRSPARYNHKRVTLNGVLRNDPLELFKNAAEARKADVRKSIWLVIPPNWRDSGPYDMRRVRVVGTVDASQHGTRGNACELLVENLTVLSGPVLPWKDSVIVFRNETRATVLVRFGDPPSQSEVSIPANTYHAMLSPEVEYSNVARAVAGDGKVIAEANIRVGPRTQLYDTKNAASYFRVTEKGIVPVPPVIARNWGWKR